MTLRMLSAIHRFVTCTLAIAVLRQIQAVINTIYDKTYRSHLYGNTTATFRCPYTWNIIRGKLPVSGNSQW